MVFLEELFGPSWRSSTIGLGTIVLGLILILIGFASGDTTLKAMGITMIPSAGLAFVVRDNQASVASHQESLAGLESAHANHAKNQAKIAHLEDKVEAVPTIVAKVVEAKVPEVVADVIVPAVATVLNDPGSERRR